MALAFLDGELDLILASDNNIRCQECTKRLASWLAAKRGEKQLIPHCGWCLLYGGSQWAYDNRDEIRYLGEYIRGTALNSLGKRTHVPELDERHRLGWRDAERAIMGIVFTSRTLKMSFSRIAQVRARAEELYGRGDEETGGRDGRDVSAPESGAAGEAEERPGG